MNYGHRQPTLTAAPHLPLPLPILILMLTASTSTAQSNSNSNSNDANNSYLGNTSVSPSMAIIIVVLISAFFFLGFFSIYIRQCSGDRNSSIRATTNASVANPGRSRRNRGLNKEALDSFPTFLYSEVRERKIGKGSLECAVCLSEFEDDETLRLLPNCSHVFHHDCIDAWLAAHVTCPVCRTNLVPDPNADQELVPPIVESVNADTERTDQEPSSHHVTVEIDEEVDEEHHDVIENLERFVNMKRAKSRARPAVFPRSHSTGHSVVRPGENLDRFTLRLPEDVRREIVEASSNNGRFKRTTSLLVFSTEEGSVGRAGPRMGRSDRLGSFFMRTFSVRNWGRRGGDEGGSSRGGFFFRRGEPGSSSVKGEGSVKGTVTFSGVIAPFDCYGGGKRSAVDEKEDESSAAALNRV